MGACVSNSKKQVDRENDVSPSRVTLAPDMPESQTSFQTMIFDNGSSYLKAGMAGDGVPRTLIPNLIGRAKQTVKATTSDGQEVYLGFEAQDKASVMKIKCPLENGVIKNWDDMEKLWDYIILNQMDVDIKNECIFITESPFSSKADRQKTAQIIFEKYNVNYYYSSFPGCYSQYSCKRTSGIVLDIGHSYTHAVPIINNKPIPDKIQKLNFGGKHLSEYLVSLLPSPDAKGKDNQFSSSEMLEIEELKEENCFVSENYQQDLKESEGKSTEHFYNITSRTSTIPQKSLFACPCTLR